MCALELGPSLSMLFVRIRQRLRRDRLNVFVSLLLTLYLAACTPLPLTPLPAPLPTASPTRLKLQAPIESAVAYLQDEYNPDIGLIRESPKSFPNRYWLATDNWLAALALRTYDGALADTLTRTIQGYGGVQHGLIEALTGATVVWPPYVAQQEPVDAQGVWVERRTQGARHEDWADYSDLALYAALNAHNQGQIDEARQLYHQALAQFDGVGFADLAWREDQRHYATYKLALAIYVGGQLGEPPSGEILAALLAQQTPSGGFTALYTMGDTEGESNTETTAYALLALTQLAGGR